MLIHQSYLRAFNKFAASVLEESTDFVQIGNYANLLTEKANQLIRRAELNKNITVSNLQKDMFESGGIFIKRFSQKFKEVKSMQDKTYEGRPPVVDGRYMFSRAS